MPPVLRRFWTQPRRIFRELLALDDTAHAIAAVAALGIWIGLTPTVGAQMVIVALIALCARGWLYFNRTAALLMVYITNPFTIVPIYWFNYRVGLAMLGQTRGQADQSELAATLQYDSLAGWWDSVQTLAVTVGWPLLAGSLVVATIGAAATYPLVAWAIRKLRAETDLVPDADPAAEQDRRVA